MKTRKRFTVKYRLLSAFIILLLVPTTLIGLFSYQKLKEELEKHYIQSASESVNVINNMVTSIIEPKMDNVSIFSEEIQASSSDEENSTKSQSLLDDYMKFHQDLDTVYVGTELGTMIRSPQKDLGSDYDPRERPWYQLAMENKGEVVVTDPFVSAGTGNLVISVARTTIEGIAPF